MAFAFVSQNGQLDMTGREQDLADLASNRTIYLDLLPASSLQNSFALYRDPIDGDDCFSQSSELTLSCVQKITSLTVSFGIGRFCTEDVPGGRLGCALNVLLAWQQVSVPLLFCSDPQPDDGIVFTSPGINVARWQCEFIGFNPTSVGQYVAISGTVTVTPVYGNPLP